MINCKIILSNILALTVLPQVSFVMADNDSHICNEHNYGYVRPDFAKVSKSKYFVDKTELLLDVINEPSSILVSAPRRFGKSVNADMIKRFFEIEVDDKGDEVKIKSNTSNYKVFAGLNIQKKYSTFFHEYFGRIPVVYINYFPLWNISEFNQVFDAFSVIISNTYKEHEYLRNISHLWAFFNISEFDVHLEPKSIQDIGLMRSSFIYLIQILRFHFERRPLVIIDEQDALVETAIFSKCQVLMRLGTKVQRCVTDRMIRPDDDHLFKAVITGSLRVRNLGMSPLGQNISENMFLGNHVFSKHYGLTESELDRLLLMEVNGETERRRAKRIIEDYYGGYVVREQNLKIYNMGSVIEHLNNARNPKGYWYKYNYFKNFTNIFSIPELCNKMKSIMLGMTTKQNISDFITKYHVIKLYKLNFNLKIDKGDDLVWFTSFIYKLGYLAASDQPTANNSLVSVKIANLEVTYDLITAMRWIFIDIYNYSEFVAQKLQSAVDSFRPELFRPEVIHEFYDSVHKLFTSTEYRPKSDVDVQSVIFVYLFRKFPLSRPHVTKLYGNKGEIIGEVCDLIIVNKNVAAYIAIKTTSTETRRAHNTTLDELSLKSHNRVFSTYEQQAIVNNIIHLDATVYIGLVYQVNDKKIAVAFSAIGKYKSYLNKTIVINR